MKQMVGSEDVKHSVNGNKYTGFLLLGESPEGLFIRVVRMSGNNVRTSLSNHPVYTECAIMGALQSFHTLNYFT
jgi:hypothetical protein